MAHAPRNNFLIPGVTRYSRTATYRKRALFKRKRTAVTNPKVDVKTTKTVQVKGGTRVVPLNKAPRFYPAEDVPKPKVSRKTNKSTRLRHSITPGTVLILLAGRFRGRRVVFLKQLKSGLLLVTGPYKVNGVPLRRVNQAYVIATSTKVDLKGCKLSDIGDEHFKREKVVDKKETSQQKKACPGHKVDKQKEIDKSILAAVAQVPHVKDYLHARFSLSKGQFPHLMKF